MSTFSLRLHVFIVALAMCSSIFSSTLNASFRLVSALAIPSIAQGMRQLVIKTAYAQEAESRQKAFEEQYRKDTTDALTRYGSPATPHISFHSTQYFVEQLNKSSTVLAGASFSANRIWVNSMRLGRFPRSIQKLVAYHEAAHIAGRHAWNPSADTAIAYIPALGTILYTKFNEGKIRYGFIDTIGSNRIVQDPYSQKAKEHYADTRAAHALQCATCLREYAIHTNDAMKKPKGYLISHELAALAEQYEGTSCPTHQSPVLKTEVLHVGMHEHS